MDYILYKWRLFMVIYYNNIFFCMRYSIYYLVYRITEWIINYNIYAIYILQSKKEYSVLYIYNGYQNVCL